MRISDWSSDVCSSDLGFNCEMRGSYHADSAAVARERTLAFLARSEERRVGKECVVRVDLGGRRIIKKKKNIIDYQLEESASRVLIDHKVTRVLVYEAVL